MRRLPQYFVAAAALLISIVAIQTFTGLLPDYRVIGEKEHHFPSFSFSSFFTQRFQVAFQEYLAHHIGFRGTLIRLDNQVYYSLFYEIRPRESTDIVLGKNNYLFEANYIASFNRLDVVPRQELEEKVKRIKELQSLLEGRGIPFLFLITPSKAAIYPEYIKEKNLVKRREAIPSNHENLLPLLEEYQVNYFDGHKFMSELKRRSRHPVFPRTGTHWNYYAVYLCAIDIVKKLEQVSGWDMQNMYLFGTEETSEPAGHDADIFRRINVFTKRPFYDKPYLYPIGESIQTPETFRPVILFEGASFLENLIEYFRQTRISELMHYINRFRQIVTYHGNAGDDAAPEVRKEIDLMKLLNSSNVVILEANEARLANIGDGFVEAAIDTLQ
jgi:hypothetical protein